MANDNPAARRYRFTDYRLDLERGVLLRDDEEIPLRRQSFDVLRYLVRNEGRLVTREELLEAVWAGKVVTDASLTQCMVDIRAAIDDPTHEKIRTLTGRGYRFELDVVPEDAAPEEEVPEAGVDGAGGHAPRRGRMTHLARVAAAALVLVLAYTAIDRFVLESGSAPAPVSVGTPDATAMVEGRGNPPETIVAVLPFDSQSTAEEDAYLAEGLADEILSALARRQAVPVIGGASSFQFRGETKRDLPTLVARLGATHVVDGSMRRSEDGYRVSARLVETASGRVSWSDTYTRTARDVYAIPSAAASAILTALGQADADTDGAVGAAPDPEAYRIYLTARAQLRNPLLPGSNGIRRVISTLEDVVRLDAGLAEAWAALALSRLNIAVVEPGREATGFRNRDPEQRMATAREEAERALALDPTAADALLALAIIDYRARLIPLAEAERRFREVLERSPDNPDVNVRMGMMLLELGRVREASDHFARSARLDPLNPTTYGFYLPSLLHIGRDEEARRVIEGGLTPWYFGTFQRLEHALVHGRVDEARDWLEVARAAPTYLPHGVIPGVGQPSEDKDRLDRLFDRLVAVEASGDPASDATLPTELIAAADHGLLLHTYVALLLAAVGYEDPVFELVLDRLNVDDLYARSNIFRPAFAKLRRDPRVMRWFDAGTQLDYWLETDRWPDFCAEPGLPYDCREAAELYVAGR